MPASKKSECSSGQKEVDKTHNLGYAEDTIMTCAMQCMRMNFPAMPAPRIHASTADAEMLVLVQAPFSNRAIFMAVDMAYKNSVLAVYRKLIRTGSHFPVRVNGG